MRSSGRRPGGASLDVTELQGFPHKGFDSGMTVALPAPKASVSRLLEPFAALAYYEGFCFWVKGDGADHVLRLSLTGADGRPFLFTTPVRGVAWKLVFAGFENFKIGKAPFEVEESEQVRLAIALDPVSPAPARITLGPFRLGYEK